MISYIAKRHSEANNKYMKNYDPTELLKYIEYLDKNNLYDWSMNGYLSYSGFKCLKNIDNFEVKSISENSSKGYILEADLEYPDELHVLHNDLLLAPEKLAIPYDMLSNCCKKNCRRIWNKSCQCKTINSKFK